jgi:hypothetical protein
MRPLPAFALAVAAVAASVKLQPQDNTARDGNAAIYRDCPEIRQIRSARRRNYRRRN